MISVGHNDLLWRALTITRLNHNANIIPMAGQIYMYFAFVACLPNGNCAGHNCVMYARMLFSLLLYLLCRDCCLCCSPNDLFHHPTWALYRANSTCSLKRPLMKGHGGHTHAHTQTAVPCNLRCPAPPSRRMSANENGWTKKELSQAGALCRRAQRTYNKTVVVVVAIQSFSGNCGISAAATMYVR